MTRTTSPELPARAIDGANADYLDLTGDLYMGRGSCGGVHLAKAGVGAEAGCGRSQMQPHPLHASRPKGILLARE